MGPSPLVSSSMFALYVAVVFLLARAFAGGTSTKVGFLAADRLLPEWRAAFSIASSWIWAPALFVAAQKAYTEGLVGLFWFTAPNVLTLVLFGHFGEVLREKLPRGYTLTAYMKEVYGRRVHGLYLFQSFGLLISCLAVQMLGGGKLLSSITALPFPVVTLFLALTSISYTLLYGLKASVITDWFKMVLLLALLGIMIPWAVSNGGGLSTLRAGLGGKSGDYLSLFSPQGASVFWSFGLATTIGLLSGPFGDQAFYQRAFAVTASGVRGAFYKGAMIFAAVPLSMSLLGFVMAGSGAAVSDPALVNLAAVQAYLPTWAIGLFSFLLVSALLSAMDSHFTAIGSLAGHDLSTHRPDGDPDRTSSEEDGRALAWSRKGMLAGAVAAIGIANIPGMQILYLFLFYGTLRSSTMLPTILTVLSGRRYPEKGVFAGILFSLLIGLPLFSYGNFTRDTTLIVAGSLTTLLGSGLIMLAAALFERTRR